MATQIWGPIGPRKKRCPKCDGTAISKYTYNDGTHVACGHCEGKGYVCAECNGTGGTIGNECSCGDGIWYS